MTSDVYVIAAKRSIVAPIRGALASLEPHELAAGVISDAISAAQKEPAEIDELIVSNALGAGGNPARLCALAAGLPEHVAGLSIDRQCVGGLDAILLAAALVRSGQADTVVAGGVESYSRRPIRMAQSINQVLQPYDRPAFAPDAKDDPDLAFAADEVAHKFSISRNEQDNFAILSHKKALAHRNDLWSEIVTLDGIKQKHDTYPRKIGPQLCARAVPISGSVTMANTAVAADGAAFVVVSNRPPQSGHYLRLIGGVTLGSQPSQPALAPVDAIKSVLGHTKLNGSEIDIIEMMEAYAAQAIACLRLTGLEKHPFNIKGGALARGHPIGASGAILAVRLFHDLSDGQTGLAAIAAAGGLGSAAIFQAATS